MANFLLGLSVILGFAVWYLFDRNTYLQQELVKAEHIALVATELKDMSIAKNFRDNIKCKKQKETSERIADELCNQKIKLHSTNVGDTVILSVP